MTSTENRNRRSDYRNKLRHYRSPPFSSLVSILITTTAFFLVLRTTVTPIRRKLSLPFQQSTTTSMAIRDVEKVVIAREQAEGLGARVRRSIGRPELPNLDPFLLLDEFHVTKPAGFPDHPHRGMQTVTYMLEGAFKHADNKGHEGVVLPGALQWMTAGRGIVHSEFPHSDGENIGLQLWVNLAKKDKMTKPEYQELLADEVPTAKNKEGTIEVKVMAGKCFDVESKVFTATPTLYWDVKLLDSATFEERIPTEYNAFIYVLEGTVHTGEKEAVGKHGSCIVYGPGEGIKVTSHGKARFVVLAGKPLNEPVVQHGPFVMNSREEIMQAFQDYSDGKF